MAQVEIFTDPEDGELILARCTAHPFAPLCRWSERYDTMDDATQYAATHADGGR